MKTEHLVYKITIDGPREKVWSALFDDATYRQWTAVFAEGSYALTDWKKGSKVQFLDVNKNGMLAKIADVRPNEFMSLLHHGEIRRGVEFPNPTWSGYENYTLKDASGKTELTIDLDAPESFVGEMNRAWPPALQKLKEIVERSDA